MRKFTQEEIDFVVDNEEKMTLRELAKKFDCDWHDVYEAYGSVVGTPEFKSRADKIRKNLAEKKAKNRLKKILERLGKMYEKTRKDIK